MDRVERNKRFLNNLFTGPHPGHGIITATEYLPEAPYPGRGDLIFSQLPLEAWVSWHLRDYQARLKRLEILDDDTVPFIRSVTGVEIFPAAFGCPVHIYPEVGQLPMAIPLVSSAEEADRLAQPGLEGREIQRFFQFAERVLERAGPEVMISVPDMQSPFDIAAMVWRKEDFLLATQEHPDAVKRLVDKCHRLLKSFLLEFKRRFPNGTLVNWPYVGVPVELGCEYAEDECGNISAAAFEEFCLPVSEDMSKTFGGLFIHCCAKADHQHANFKKIPNLRGLEHGFSSAAVQTFSGHTVMIVGVDSEETLRANLEAALPGACFLFMTSVGPIEEAKRLHDRLRSHAHELK